MTLAANRARVIGWALAPGDLVAFHAHPACQRRAAAQRDAVFSARYLGDDGACAAAVAPPGFSGLGSQLAAGCQLTHPLFPGVARAVYNR